MMIKSGKIYLSEISRDPASLSDIVYAAKTGDSIYPNRNSDTPIFVKEGDDPGSIWKSATEEDFVLFGDDLVEYLTM